METETTAPDFSAIATLADLADGVPLRVRAGSHTLVLIRTGDVVHACQALCPHEKAGLDLARIEAGRLVCPRHLASFDLCDGSVSAGWSVDALKLYPTRIDGEAVLVDMAAVRRNPPGGTAKVWDFTAR